MSVQPRREEVPRVRQRERDRTRTALLTTPGGPDKHRHCAVFLGDTGNGETDPGPDGHVHLIRWLDVLPCGGHTHELSIERCPRKHNFDPTHGSLHVNEGR
jgi:hypothetical protein